jgi:hypothetical protein
VKSENRPIADVHLTKEEKSVKQKAWNNPMEWIFKLVPWIEKWDIAKEDKQDCYHVLWIE